jgi:hypothetical protein
VCKASCGFVVAISGLNLPTSSGASLLIEEKVAGAVATKQAVRVWHQEMKVHFEKLCFIMNSSSS